MSLYFLKEILVRGKKPVKIFISSIWRKFKVPAWRQQSYIEPFHIPAITLVQAFVIPNLMYSKTPPCVQPLVFSLAPLLCLTSCRTHYQMLGTASWQPQAAPGSLSAHSFPLCVSSQKLHFSFSELFVLP